MQDEIVESLSEDNIPLTPHMLQQLLEAMVANHEHERAIFLFRDIRARGVQPRSISYRLMITLCTNVNEAEEAFRLLIDFKNSLPNVPEHFWWSVLESCAWNGFVFSVSRSATDVSWKESCIAGSIYRNFLMSLFPKVCAYRFFPSLHSMDNPHWQHQYLAPYQI